MRKDGGDDGNCTRFSFWRELPQTNVPSVKTLMRVVCRVLVSVYVSLYAPLCVAPKGQLPNNEGVTLRQPALALGFLPASLVPLQRA